MTFNVCLTPHNVVRLLQQIESIRNKLPPGKETVVWRQYFRIFNELDFPSEMNLCLKYYQARNRLGTLEGQRVF